jgi:hypothetical protein
LIQWLEEWGPKLILERNVLATEEWEKDPIVVLATDMSGLVAAKEILGPTPDSIVYCHFEELQNAPKDEDFRFHCVLSSYFETLTGDQEQSLRKQYKVGNADQLWSHYNCSTMGPLFARGGKHLWVYKNNEAKLIKEGYELWIS